MCILLHVYIYIINRCYEKDEKDTLICTSPYACIYAFSLFARNPGHVHFVWWYLCKTLSPNKVLFFGTAGGCLEVHIASIHFFKACLKESLESLGWNAMVSGWSLTTFMCFPCLILFNARGSVGPVGCSFLRHQRPRDLPHQVKTPSASPIWLFRRDPQKNLTMIWCNVLFWYVYRIKSR